MKTTAAVSALACLCAAGVLLTANECRAQPVTTGELRSYSTPQSIGIEWDVTGDDNHDATAAVRYRPQGSTRWSDAFPLFRIDFAGSNMLAGSIFFLDGSTDYEVELDVSDPDGGGEQTTVMVRTLDVPQLPTSGRTLYVIPGAGGGDGSEADPFQGIAAADAQAQPGDIFLLGSGDYGPEQQHFTTAGTQGNYVVWMAAPDATPAFPDLRVSGDYIWLEGLTISAPNNAVRNEGPSFGAVLKGNHISGCHYCIHFNTGAESWWISDNVIIGDQDPTSGSFAGEGIELAHTPGHTIAYNSISRAADAVSYPLHNVDIFNNEIFETSDDGVEADDGAANVRVYRNRITNAGNNGITFQPMNSAPWYVLYNQVIGSSGSVLKVRDAVDRVLLAHNTFVGWTRVYQHQAGWIRNMHVRNNLWITMTGDYLWEDTGNPAIPDNWRTSLDYDGFAWPESTTNYVFKWHDIRYYTLMDLQAATTIEQNGIRTPMSCFDTLDVPGAPPTVVPLQHVTLADGCNAIDAAEVLANINDGFAGAGPDLGAHERGLPPMHYGPRTGQGGGGGAGGGNATNSGSGAASGSGSASGGSGAGGGGSEDDGGCGCRVAGHGNGSTGWAWLALLSLAAPIARRRSRRAGS